MHVVSASCPCIHKAESDADRDRGIRIYARTERGDADEDIKLPLILISASEFVYGLVIYLLMFLLRSEFDFLHYLSHIIIPELIYTIAVTLLFYPVILFINHKLDAEEKRSTSKFV